MDTPLKTFVAIPGKTLFGRLGDPRVRTYPADWRGAVEPDLVVLSCSQASRFDPSAIRLPDGAAQRLRDGRAVAVFDASLEAMPHTPAWAGAMFEVLARLGVDPGRAVYVTQDRGWRGDHRAWCAATGHAPMGVLEYDYWIARFFAGVGRDGPATYEARRAAFVARPARRSRRFLSLNWTMRPAKVLFLLRLMKDGLFDQGWISFGGLQVLRRAQNRGLHQFAKRLRLQTAFADLIAELEPDLPKLEALGQISLGLPEGDQEDPDLASDASLPAYGDSWFSVVTESEMLDRFTRVTEKPFKALVNFHPLILLANPGALAFVRGLGFQGFGALFDEAYDEEPDPRRRFELVYRQVCRLCALPEAEMAKAEAALAETLDFNARWGLTRLPGIWRGRIDGAFVDGLTALVRPGAGA